MTAIPSPPFDWLDGEGQNPAEQNKEMLEAIRLEQIEQAKMINDVMTDGRGAEFLDWLRSMTVDIPLLQVSGTLVNGEVALSPSDWAYIREGQNSVYREIIRQMQVAMQPVEQP